MSKTNDGTTRRDVLKLAAGGAALAATNGLLLPSTAQAANKLKLMKGVRPIMSLKLKKLKNFWM